MSFIFNPPKIKIKIYCLKNRSSLLVKERLQRYQYILKDLQQDLHLQHLSVHSLLGEDSYSQEYVSGVPPEFPLFHFFIRGYEVGGSLQKTQRGNSLLE